MLSLVFVTKKKTLEYVIFGIQLEVKVGTNNYVFIRQEGDEFALKNLVFDQEVGNSIIYVVKTWFNMQ